MSTMLDFSIDKIGEPETQSPISLSKKKGDGIANYVTDDEYILYNLEHNSSHEDDDKQKGIIEKAGPREKIFFNPDDVKVAIVTCGGLCPGLNDVIRAIVNCLWYQYKVIDITGIKYGLKGFYPEYNVPTIGLNPKVVKDIHTIGGTMLSSGRGYGRNYAEILGHIVDRKFNMVFFIGGDGTQTAAHNIARLAKEQSLEMSIIGIPKTIDNDLSFSDKSFGFESAVAAAVEAVKGAHVEANGAENGIGIVKVMGRESGFIAAHTALAINDANFVLIPECKFELEGEAGLLSNIHKRLTRSKHCVILVAEGAGQELLDAESELDDSGNKKLGDIGLYLKEKIDAYFEDKDIDHTIKYIDPSYMIRSTPANPNDSLYCLRLGNSAVHAAMSGRTDMLVTRLHNRMVHVPIGLAISKRNFVDIEAALWRDVLESTGQPISMTN